MGIFDKFWKKTGRVLVKGDEIINMSYESDTFKNIDSLVKYLEKIHSLLRFIKTENRKVSEDIKIQFLKILKVYNKLIDNEIIRIKSNKNGLFLIDIGNELSPQEKKLNENYISNLVIAKLETEIEKMNLDKINHLIAALNFFKKRLYIYLSNQI